MTLDELLELAAGLILAFALAAAAVALVPPTWAWAAGLAVLGVALYVQSLIIARANPKPSGGDEQ